MTIEVLPESVSVLYSELVDQCWRSVYDGRGINFVKKTVKRKTYWYLQHVIGPKKTQHYLGPESEGLIKEIESEKRLWGQVTSEIETRQRIVSMLASGGAETLLHTEAMVMKLLERTGVFLAGGVLVGSQAFRQYGNTLGVRLDQKAIRTHGVDLAAPATVAIGISEEPVNLRSRLIESDLGFFEIPALDKKHPSTSFSIRGKQLRVDLLTPMKGKPDARPVFLPWMKACAEPVRFLDYLMDDVQRAVVVSHDGILVNIPNPGRFALHKLVVSQRRNASEVAKSRKDIRQADQLLEILLSIRPGDVELAAIAARKEPPRFRKHLFSAVEYLSQPVRDPIRKVLSGRDENP